MAITLLCWCRNDSEVSSAAKAFKGRKGGAVGGELEEDGFARDPRELDPADETED